LIFIENIEARINALIPSDEIEAHIIVLIPVAIINGHSLILTPVPGIRVCTGETVFVVE
jgi:hypothetical protein